jgi:hypothetical protein
MDDSVPENQASREINKRQLAQKLDAAGWGLFFIWVGAALLMGLSWGAGLLGVGLITLGGQVARRHFGLGVQVFWVVVGLLFIVGSVWELYRVEVSLVPILLIIAGAALLVSIFRAGPHSSQ